MTNLDERREIGNRLQVARKQAGLSQGQVATLLGLHRPSISEIEAGRRGVSAEELARFAEIYDVSVDWVLGSTPPGTRPEVELAARELGKLKPEDLDLVLGLLSRIRMEKQS